MKIRNKLFEKVIWLFYSFVSFGLIWFHEPWRDEAQAWLIVRDLNFWEIIKQMVWEGSPALWHLMLFPLAKTGLPYVSMFIFHWIIAIIIIWLILFRSPFPKLLKLGLSFSYLMCFEYVIIARNYNISILLLLLILTMYNRRFSRPILFSLLLFLLFNTNIHSLGAAIMLSAIFIWQYVSSGKFVWNKIISILIIIFGFTLVFIQIPPFRTIKYNAIVETSNLNMPAIFKAIGDSFLPMFKLNIFSQVILIFIFLIFLMRFLQRPVVFSFFVISTGWLLFIFGMIHVGELRHHGLILIMIIVSLWLENFHKSIPLGSYGIRSNLKYIALLSRNILIVCLLVSISRTIIIYQTEFKYSYSGSKDAAEFISKNVSPDQTIIAHRSYACSSILPFIPKHKFWYADIESFGSFITWNTKFRDNAYDMTLQEVIERADRYFGKKKDRIYLLTSSIKDPKYELLYRTKRFVFEKKDEKFYVYKRIP